MVSEDVKAILGTPDAEGRYHGYYDLDYGVNEAEALRQRLISFVAGMKCADCDDEPCCPTHALVYDKINRLGELAGAEWFDKPAEGDADVKGVPTSTA